MPIGRTAPGADIVCGYLCASTIGDVARHGLELHVYCPTCYSTRWPLAANLERWADRCFATARLRCTGTRHTGAPCQATGMPVIRPAELLPVGGLVTLAFLSCPSCIWEINQVRLDQPPWSGSRQHYRCPGCGGRVQWNIHGPAWRPFASTRLSCCSFAANAVRLQLHALAYNLANFMRTLALPEAVAQWSLSSLREKLIKIGAKVVHHAR